MKSKYPFIYIGVLIVLIGAFVLPIVGFSKSSTDLTAGASCEIISTRTFPQPDGTYTVKVVEQVCGNGAKGTVMQDFYNFAFYLINSSGKGIADPFLVIDGGSGTPQYRDVRWVSPMTIEILLVHRAIVAHQQQSVRDMHIDLKYDPSQAAGSR
jgi:hypothetical protein